MHRMRRPGPECRVLLGYAMHQCVWYGKVHPSAEYKADLMCFEGPLHHALPMQQCLFVTRSR